MTKVLLVEDSLDIQDLIKLTIGDACQLEIAGTQKQALELIDKHKFKIAFLDINLPDGDGYLVCSHLNQLEPNSRPEVIFLSSKDKTDEIVLGYQIGADDYITKPFDRKILKAKFEARLNKLKKPINLNQDFGYLTICHSQYRAKNRLLNPNGVDIELTPAEFKILDYLSKNEGKLLTRDQIIDAVWNSTVYIGGRSIDNHMSSLRKKLEDLSPYIKTIYGAGYIFDTSLVSNRTG